MADAFCNGKKGLCYKMRILLPWPKIASYIKLSALNTKFFVLCMISHLSKKNNIFLSCRDQGIVYLNVRCKSSEKETHSLFIFQKSQKVDRGKSPQKLYVHEFPTNRNLCVAFCVRSKGLNGQNHSLLDSHP